MTVAIDVGIVMGSKNDWETMSAAAEVLAEFGFAHEVRVMSAHRTPDIAFEYSASAVKRGLKAIIAGAGGAAHLAGVMAAKTTLPVIGVPVQSKALNGLDSLLSTVQMPRGTPVATMAIGASGAANAALFVVAMLAVERPAMRQKLEQFRAKQAQAVIDNPDPRK